MKLSRIKLLAVMLLLSVGAAVSYAVFIIQQPSNQLPPNLAAIPSPSPIKSLSPAPTGQALARSADLSVGENVGGSDETVEPTISFPAPVSPETTPAPVSANLPTEDALPSDSDTGSEVSIVIHAESEDPKTGLIGGVSIKRDSGVNDPLVIASASPTPVNNKDEKLERVGGQARGFTMIGMMQPNARLTMEAVVDVLLRSEIDEPYISALVDGSFSIDFDYLNSVIRRLNQGGRKVTLALYLSNGPSQRKFDFTPIAAGFNLIEPSLFRELIQYDRKTRSDFETIVNRTKESYLLNRSLNSENSNLAVMMLEDNLDSASYAAMRKIAEAVLPPDVEYVRNPCPGCYSGNDVSTLGDGLEAHDPALIGILRTSDGYSLDGFGYLYPDETGGQLPYKQVQALLHHSIDQGLRYFGLWRAGKQGLGPQGQIHPDERDFEVPTEEQKLREIDLLREGLTPVSSETIDGTTSN